MQSTGYFATIYRFGVLICGPKNRVFDIKSGHDFCRYRNSIQVIYFQINDSSSHSGAFTIYEISICISQAFHFQPPDVFECGTVREVSFEIATKNLSKNLFPGKNNCLVIVKFQRVQQYLSTCDLVPLS